MNYYDAHARHYVGVDCVIFGLREGRLNILLIKRRMMPGRDKWSLMGGFVEEAESLDDAAKRVLHIDVFKSGELMEHPFIFLM